MNYAIVFRLLGYILMIEGVLLLLPAVTSLIYAEWAVMGVFLLTAAISAALGLGLRTIKPRSKVFYMREGFAATALSWIAISIVGAVPFVLTGCIPNPVDALFETAALSGCKQDRHLCGRARAAHQVRPDRAAGAGRCGHP